MIHAVNFPILKAIGKKTPEKIKTSTGFEPVTSAILGSIFAALSCLVYPGEERGLLYRTAAGNRAYRNTGALPTEL